MNAVLSRSAYADFSRKGFNDVFPWMHAYCYANYVIVCQPLNLGLPKPSNHSPTSERIPTVTRVKAGRL